MPPKAKTLKDPEFWVNTAVHLIQGNLGSLAGDCAKLLKDYQKDVRRQLETLYWETFKACLHPYGLKIDKPRFTEHAPEQLDPLFPTHYPLFQQLVETLQQKTARLEQDRPDFFELCDQLRIHFGQKMNALKGKKQYARVNALIDLKAKAYETPDGMLIEHVNAVLQKAGSDPLPIDPEVTLWQIYITPSAKRWDEADELQHPGRQVNNVIGDILSKLTQQAAAIILHGQPGHGKTSTAQMLVHAVTLKNRMTAVKDRLEVLYYEFRKLGHFDANVLSVLSRVTPFVKQRGFFGGKKTILILDGMDERQFTEPSNRELKTFIQDLFFFAEDINSRPNSQLSLIFTGRTQFFHQIKTAFSSAYTVYQLNDFNQARVNKWLDKYSRHKKLQRKLSYDDFKDKYLKQLIEQPILLTIMSLMLIDTQGAALMQEIDKREVTRGKIYRTIITWTYQRKWQSSHREHIEEDSYHAFLKVLAFILFKKNCAQIKTSELIDIMRSEGVSHYYDMVQHKSREEIEALCHSLAISFYFEGIKDRAFSFIHNTIRDYLAVEAVFYMLSQTVEYYRERLPDCGCGDMARYIYFTLGGASLSHEAHAAFIADVIRMNKASAEALFVPLKTFFVKCLENTYLLEHAGMHDLDPVIVQANVLGNLFRLLTTIFYVFRKEKHKGFDNGGLTLFEQEDSFYKFISLLNAAGQNFGYQKFDMGYLNCRGANLRDTNLSGSNFEGTDFEGANLSDANLSHAKLANAILRGANAYNANLSGADLSKAVLNEANLSDANLSHANVRGAFFRHTSMLNTLVHGVDFGPAEAVTQEQLKKTIGNAQGS